jgi:CDP-paratose 2-epimerase
MPISSGRRAYESPARRRYTALMAVALITGSAGLIGSEAVDSFVARGFDVVGIDNDMRKRFFGDDASTSWQRAELERRHGTRYTHEDMDIRDASAVMRVFERYGLQLTAVIHTAAQPSHDWAAREPFTDFGVNAVGTLNLLEACREHSPDAVFVFTSTNKVYGDTPNRLPLVEQETRWEIDPSHPFVNGIDESMSIDQSTHSLFGASKVAADILVQEYGRYFGMRTGVFRGGCLTGPHHSGTMLHGFLAYLMKCTVTETPYRVFGYKGKQVRDNIHSADLVSALHAFVDAPRVGEVYSIGGSRFSHCSMLEAIALCQEISGCELPWTYEDKNRIGDHIWYVSDIGKFQRHFPAWTQRYDVKSLLQDIHDQNVERWQAAATL